jgi:hypothetical protein
VKLAKSTERIGECVGGLVVAVTSGEGDTLGVSDGCRVTALLFEQATSVRPITRIMQTTTKVSIRIMAEPRILTTASAYFVKHLMKLSER